MPDWKKFGKSKSSNFEVIGSAKGPDGQNALLVGCKVHMDEARDELFEYLNRVKKSRVGKGFSGFVFKKQY